MIPFKYGCVVSGDNFCPRPELERQLLEFAKSGQNLVIQGGRRMGKTSLLREVFGGRRDIHLIYIDLYFIRSAVDFCNGVMKGIAKANVELPFLRRVMDFALRLRPTLSFDPADGTPTISVDAKAAAMPESVGAVMEALAKLAAERKTLVVFDEFQDILSLEGCDRILAEMRSVIQLQADTAYFFTGSVRHDMMRLFDSPDSPFYKSALPFSVDEIAPASFASFLEGRFRAGGRPATREVVEQAIRFADGVPGDAQELCEALWSIGEQGREITVADFPAALSLIFSREIRGYEEILQRLTNAQATVLKAFSKDGRSRPGASAFIEAVNLAPSTIRRALGRLLSDNVLLMRNGEYRFSNPFFREWLLRNG